MPSLSQLPGNINRKKFLRALVRLGFEVNLSGGKGDHQKLIGQPPKNVSRFKKI